jgi:FAD synthase
MDDRVPPTVSDPVIEAYMVDIDRTLLQANLKLSVEDRIRQLQQFQKLAVELQRAGREARAWKRPDCPKVTFHV